MQRKPRFGFFVLVAVALLCGAPAVHAADGKGHFAFRGMGGESCKTAMDQMQKDRNELLITASWLMGYVTAVNRKEPDTFDISPLVSPSSLLEAVVGLCTSHPDMAVETVFSNLLAALSIARNRTDSPLIETKSGKNSATVRTETWIAMQTRLAGFGYLKGKPDATFGARGQTALRAFQKDQKLPETGVADPSTIIRLLVELPAKQN